MEDLEIGCCDIEGNGVDLGGYVEGVVVVDLYCDGDVGTAYLNTEKARAMRDWLTQWIEEQESNSHLETSETVETTDSA